MYHLLTTFKNSQIVGIKFPSSCDAEKLYVDPSFCYTIAEELQKKSAFPFLCNTVNSFQDRNANAINSIIAWHKAGFSEARLPILTLDGLNGSSEFTSNLSTKVHHKATLACELQNIDGLIVLSTPWAEAPKAFKGAIHSLGAELASKRGKVFLNSSSKPKVNKDRCYHCRKCMHECPAGAIYFDNRRVAIDEEKCIDCGRCVEVAAYGGIRYEWDTPSEVYQLRVAQYAQAAQHELNGSLLFCNFLLEDNENSQLPKSRQKGILLSHDAVAIDKATLDLTCRHPQEDICSHKGLAHQQIDHGKKLEIGTDSYELVTISF
jgi:uncharacterized Fe-S center protein